MPLYGCCLSKLFFVCQQQVGWRNESRRILLYATDGGYHIAGDGKVANVINSVGVQSFQVFNLCNSVEYQLNIVLAYY